jgi:hypothetical protein
MAATALGLALTAALIGDTTTPVGLQMTAAAKKFLDGLPADQRQQALFDYDSPERLKWHFVPLQANRQPLRKGVRLEHLSEASREAALALLRTGTSPQGFEQATAIMSLEAVLADLEKGRKGGSVRDPSWYFVSLFGEPSQTKPWGWRVEGHHMSVNVTLKGGEVVANTPILFGSNPAVIQDGPMKGRRTLMDVDDLGRELAVSLNEEQQKLAIRDKLFPEIEPTPSARVGAPVGIPYDKLTEAQQSILRSLMRAYTNRMPGPVGQAEYAAAQKAGLEKVHFAYAGGTKMGQPRTYRVQGPTFLIEFQNEQADASGNPANHIHSAWRHLPTDFGLKPTS